MASVSPFTLGDARGTSDFMDDRKMPFVLVKILDIDVESMIHRANSIGGVLIIKSDR